MQQSATATRFNIILGAFGALLLLLGVVSYSSLKQELLAEQLAINEAKTAALGSRIDRWLNTRKTEISTLANTPVVRSMDWNVSGPYLKQKHQEWPWFYIFAHINPDGTYYNSKVDFAEGQNLSDRAHFKASIEGRVYASDPVVSRTLGTDIVAVTSPVYDSDASDKRIIGVFGGMIDTSTIVDELSRFQNGPNSYAFAVNSKGIAIAHPDEARRGNINTKAEPLLADADSGLSESVAQMLKGDTGWLRTTVDGLDAYVTYMPVNEADWYLATVTSAKYIDRQFVVVDYAAALVATILVIGFVMVWRSRRLEYETLSAMRQLSEERSKAKSVFLANMSHELRTPLNGILGYTQIMLAQGGQDDKSRRSLEVILNSGRHLLTLINRVLDLSKIEAGRLELEVRPVNPTNLFKDLAQVFEIERAKYRTQLKTKISDRLPEVIDIDPEKLTQVVTNVVINAFKYGDQTEVKFSIDVDQVEKSLLISVSDSGRGMSQAQIERLFIPFEQASNKSDGAGLGMAIVSELIRLMGGTVVVESELGQGTQVKLQIPFTESLNSVQDVTKGHRLPKAIEGSAVARVLIVDDGKDNRDFLRELLAPIGFTITEASDGLEAVQALQQSQFDLVITDLVMPNMDGLELVSHIRGRSDSAELPIIVASASAFHDDQVRSLALGANEFLTKPLDMYELLNRVAALLNLTYTYDEVVDPTGSLPDAQSALNVDWNDPANQSLRSAILEAAELGQVQKIQRIIDTIDDDETRARWLHLLGSLIELHDDEAIIELLEGKSDD